jgi:DNA-binding transcriptional LysR family regulator
MRYLHAAIILAEELSFTKAARRLNITQPALSKQITDLEEQCGFPLFTRDKRGIVELTDACRLFVEEAHSVLLHAERAIHLARAAHEGAESVLTIGHSPFANHEWISAMFAIRLPLYPRLRIQLMTGFAMELVRSVLVGEMNFALVMAPPQERMITAAPFAPALLYAALLDTHPAAYKESLVLEDLAKDQWILFAKRVHPLLYETILDTARRNSIIPKHAHNTMSPQQAVDLVSERVGVAILAEPTPQGFRAEGVVVRPLADASLQLETCVVMRADDDSRLVNEYVRAFLRRYSSPRLPPKTESPSASRVLNWKTTTPPSRT